MTLTTHSGVPLSVHSMKERPSCEAASCSPGQEMQCLLWSHEIH